MSARRIIAGFLIAPAVPALVVLMLQATAIAQGHAEWGTSLFVVLGYSSAIVLGLPVFLMFRRRLAASYTKYAALGAVLGAVPVLGIFAPDIVMSWDVRHEHAVLLLGSLWHLLVGGAVVGGLSASVFWLIALRRMA